MNDQVCKQNVKKNHIEAQNNMEHLKTHEPKTARINMRRKLFSFNSSIYDAESHSHDISFAS